MSQEVLVTMLLVLGFIGVGGMTFCVVLLRSAMRDQRVYEENEDRNGRPLMVIRTARRRYSIAFVMFFLALCIALGGAFMPIGVVRSGFNAFAFMTVMLLKLVNVALDAKDDRDLIQYGIERTAVRDEERDEARDTGRDPVRDEHRDVARDLEHDKENDKSV